MRAPLLQRGAVEFDPLPRYQIDCASVAEGIEASLLSSETRWFESSQAFQAEVVQWQDEGL